MDDLHHSNTRKRTPIFALLGGLIIVLTMGFASGFYYYPYKQEQQKTVEENVVDDAIVLGIAHESLASLAMIAQHEGFFAQNGVNVKVKEYASGKLALRGFMAGDVDVATSADIPIVFQSLKRQDFKIISTIGSSDNEPRIIARKDSGINTPADLRGKRVATQKASAVHFFMHVFLLKNGMTTDDIELSYMKGKNLPAALVAGEIDAFSMREPFIGQASETLGADKVVVFSEPGLYRKTFNLVASKGILRHKPDEVKHIISALMQAESYAADNPQQAMQIVATSLGTDAQKIAAIWPDISLKISLDQSLLLGLEDESQWVLSNNLSAATEPPSYLDLIHIDSLKAVNPVMVSLIH